MVNEIISFIACIAIVGLCVSGWAWFKTSRFCKKNNITYRNQNQTLDDQALVYLRKLKTRKILFFVFLSIFIVCMIVVASLLSQNTNLQLQKNN